MAFIIWIVTMLLGRTWRIRIDDPTRHSPNRSTPSATIFCFWHAHLLTIAYTFRNSGVTAMVSGSKDGRIAARVARWWRHQIISGSSTHGGVDALRQGIRVLSHKRPVAITPDGPRGPRHRVKPGVAQMAVMAQADVVILSMSSDRFWQLRSWDGFIIPKPFAHITITVSSPLTAPKKESTTITTFTQHIEQEMRGDHTMA